MHLAENAEKGSAIMIDEKYGSMFVSSGKNVI